MKLIPRIVSLVDGYNLPMRIDNNKGCGIPSCPVDLGPNCEFNFSSSRIHGTRLTPFQALPS